MKMLHYALLMLMALSIQTIAQEQPSYEAKSYRDDSGNLFWNLRLPVFVEISPVADMTGALVLNKVKTTENGKVCTPV